MPRLLQNVSLNYHFTSYSFLVSIYSCSSYSLPSKKFTLILRASTQMPFRITTKNVLQFTSRRRTADSAKEKLKGKFLKGTICREGRWQQTYQLVYSADDSTDGEWKCFLFWLCYKRNGKRCSCATIELWMHLGGLLSTTHFDSEDVYRTGWRNVRTTLTRTIMLHLLMKWLLGSNLSLVFKTSPLLSKIAMV